MLTNVFSLPFTYEFVKSFLNIFLKKFPKPPCSARKKSTEIKFQPNYMKAPSAVIPERSEGARSGKKLWYTSSVGYATTCP
jgi:hypothetical protein